MAAPEPLDDATEAYLDDLIAKAPPLTEHQIEQAARLLTAPTYPAASDTDAA